MENMKGSTNFRNMVQTGKSSLLPPKIPFPSTSTLYPDFSINPSTGTKGNPKHKDISSYHQRTSSESLIGEEQPSWLDDLLDEPDTPVRKGHRRSSSDSFAYMDMGGVSNMDYASLLHDEAQSNNMSLPQSWRSQNVDFLKVNQRGFPFNGPSSYTKPMNRTWEWPLTSAKHPRNPPSIRDNIIPYSEGSSSATEEAHSVRSTGAEKQDLGESGLSDSKFFSDNDGSYANVASDNESKRAKQKFAQRSRVRKLQYIAELERTVQALQAEGSEVSAELEFINQQSLILSMENKALKQRLESMAQEQLIKYLEHEMLEREIGRLRALYQQQQQQQPRQSTSTHRRTESKDLDSQFANLGLKHKDPSSGADTVHICDM